MPFPAAQNHVILLLDALVDMTPSVEFAGYKLVRHCVHIPTAGCLSGRLLLWQIQHHHHILHRLHLGKDLCIMHAYFLLQLSIATALILHPPQRWGRVPWKLVGFHDV